MHALGPLDLDLARGEFFAVVGPSGCGKSTLLDVLAGLSAPTAGNVTFEGKPVAGEVPDGVGVVFQEDASFPWLTVRDNVAFGLRRAGMEAARRPGAWTTPSASWACATFAHAYPAQLSGGMRQRVCIARTLVLQPRLILLDEPFGALDQQTRLLMGDELLRLWRETGATVLLITHALDEAAMLSDRVGVMSARPGRFIDLVIHRLAARARQPHRLRPRFRRRHRAPVVAAARRVDEGDRTRGMNAGARPPALSRAARIVWTRSAVVVGLVLLLELLCRIHVIKPLTMIPPSVMAVEMIRLIAAGEIADDIQQTSSEVATAFAVSVLAGFALGALMQALPRVRRALDPLLATYYAVPFFVFYPLLVALFGLNVLPLIVIGFVFATAAMVISTLNGLDRVPRVLRKVARVHRMSQLQEVALITLPSAAPHLFTGLKLALRLLLHRRHRRRVHPLRRRPRLRHRLCL